MDGLVRLVRERTLAILLLLLVGGFIMVILELVITGHTEGNQLVGVVASVLGAVLTAAAFFVNKRIAMWLAVALVVVSLSGLAGVGQHYLNRPTAIAASLEPGEAAPPPLAPLSLSGLALMAAVVIVARTPDPQAVAPQSSRRRRR